MKDIRFPKALRRGDRVVVVSPAGPLRDRQKPDLERGLARLRSWGLRPELGRHALDNLGYLAGADSARAEDLQRAIDDPEVRGVFCVRGGYGSMRILPDLDFSALAEDPKPLIGYSDITAVLAAAWHEVGLVGFHGPMVATSQSMAFGPAMRDLQRRLLGNRESATVLKQDDDVAHVVQPGSAEGRLVGGNLTLVCSLIGTPWQIDTTGRLLFLEEVGESPYRVDRLLTQLRLGGFLDRAAGIVLGDFHATDTPFGSRDPDTDRAIRSALDGLRRPTAIGFPFGHRPRSWTLPFGARARLEGPDPARPASLRLLEPATR